jgi:hypothetical protein
MPRRDRTGPWGEGPRTGRQMGPCGGGAQPDTPARPGWRGFGFGRGFGGGFGPGRGFGLGRGFGRRGRP